MRIEFRKNLVAVVANHAFHGHVYVLADARRFGGITFIDLGELVAIPEVHEGLAIAQQVQVDTAVLVIVLRIGRSIGVRETQPARIWPEHLGIITGIVAFAAVRRGPVSLLELRGVGIGQPTMAIGGNRWFEIEIITKGKG